MGDASFRPEWYCDQILEQNHWQPSARSRKRAIEAANELDGSLILALDLAGFKAEEDLARWREALFLGVRRRMFPHRFGEVDEDTTRVARFFFALAATPQAQVNEFDTASIAALLPFAPLDEQELAGWPSEEEYRRLLVQLKNDAFFPCLAMAQQWLGLSIEDHILGVTGLSLWIGRQLAHSVPVDLPLLHGAAIGHDVGKFGCVGDEEKRTPRLHYYYTHLYYTLRGLPGLGHIATNHSCWDLELIRLPIETQLLIYADFRVKDVKAADGKWRMSIISLRESFATILGKLENVDEEKHRRYKAVYRKLRDLEDYLLALGVKLDPLGFPAVKRPKPNLPKELDIVAVMAGRQRPDVVALASGPELVATARFFATAHNIGVMERLRDLPALRSLIEEARSFQGWRDLRTYLGIVGDYAPAFSQEQKELALDFFRELLSHRDDDIRYQAACRMADVLALGEESWRKDLPEGVVVEGSNWVLVQIERVLSLLDLAGREVEEDMAATEQVCYAIPVFLRRFFSRAEPDIAETARELTYQSLMAQVGDHRPLVGLYVCEAFLELLPYLTPEERLALPEVAQSWAYHEAANVRLMAWRLLLGLVQQSRTSPELTPSIQFCVELLGQRARRQNTVAELYLLDQLACGCGLVSLAERCREWREINRTPIREVMLRNLKSQVGWVEKKVNCDYLLESVRSRLADSEDQETHFANEVAFHLGNLLKVSRVEGTRFHAGRCLVSLLDILNVTQRNDLAIELVRSLQLDVEAITRYIPRFLGPMLASLPDQELVEIVEDIESDVRGGSESLQRLLLQTVAWLILSLDAERLQKSFLSRLIGVLLGALVDTRSSTAHEGFAHLATVFERLMQAKGYEPRTKMVIELAAKKLLTMVTHQPGERARFFLIAQAVSDIDRAVVEARPRVHFIEKPSVALLPGTFDPFTTAHADIVSRALHYCDEVLVQVDDYSWRKHAQPRNVRLELAWMALSAIPNAFCAPFEPPVNIANQDSLAALGQKLGRRPLSLVVGSDVLEGASAYRRQESHVFNFPHLVTTREEHVSRRWEEKLGWFRRGVQVFRVSPRLKTVSSTSLRNAFDRREDLETFCDPLVARTLRERRLYVNYPARKEEVFQSLWLMGKEHESDKLPQGLSAVVKLASVRPVARWSGKRSNMVVLSDRDSALNLAAISWQEATAAALPVALGDEALAEFAGERLMGLGALVEAVAAKEDARVFADLDVLLTRVMGQWFGDGLLFALFGVPELGGEKFWEVLRHHGAGWLTAGFNVSRGVRWASIEMTEPLVIVHDLEQVLQPQYSKSPNVLEVMQKTRRSVAGFFADRRPGAGLLHISEMETKRELVEMTRSRIGAAEPGRSWVVLGLGRQFSRDLIGDCPTLALNLERFLTWQGYEAGVHPSYGSPSLELQLRTARELGRDALLLVPFLDSVDPVLQVVEACRAMKIKLREVLIGATNAAIHASLHLAGVPHRCGFVVPHWRGVLRESALIPYIGGWSILGRHPHAGSLVASLNDCLPYHDPHPLGLDREGALDFSRLVLEQAGHLFAAIEDVFRSSEGRLLSLLELGSVVRNPRCPPFPKGFIPALDSVPSELIDEDLQALARLHPEAHHAHREGWRRE